MPRNTYTYGGMPFASQKTVREHIDWIRSDGPRVITKVDNPNEFAFLHDLYFLHPQAPEQKPLVFAFTWHDHHFGNMGVIITLDDGTYWRFPSFKWGIAVPDKHRDNPHVIWARVRRANVRQKMRGMIRYQVDDYRDNHPDGLCEICGAVGEDVDHHPMTFNEIMDTWLDGCDVGGLKIVDNTDDGYAPEFADPDLHGSWLDCHAKYARYQLLCKPCHYKKAGKNNGKK